MGLDYAEPGSRASAPKIGKLVEALISGGGRLLICHVSKNAGKKKNPRVWVTTVETKEVGMVDGLYFRIRVPGFMTISLRINMHHKNIHCTGGVHNFIINLY